MAYGVKEYKAKLSNLVESANDVSAEILLPPALKLLASIKNRIMRDGLNSNGAKIGSYSTEPMYASREQFVKKSAFKPGVKAYVATSQRIIKKKKGGYRGGKISKSVIKEKMKTMYLRDGYSQLREIQGLNSQYIDFTYTGDLMQSYTIYKGAREVLLGLNSEKQALKRQGLEARFGRVFYATEQEIREYKAEVAALIKQKTLQAYTGT